MKTASLLLIMSLVLSCSSTKKNDPKPLFEILKEDSNGGTKIEFYEILTEPNEIRVLLNDPDLKNLVKSNDTETANFVILNHGEKSTGGYSIGVESARETESSVILKIKKVSPQPGDNVTYAFTNPFTIVKINSKKPIVFE